MENHKFSLILCFSRTGSVDSTCKSNVKVTRKNPKQSFILLLNLNRKSNRQGNYEVLKKYSCKYTGS